MSAYIQIPNRTDKNNIPKNQTEEKETNPNPLLLISPNIGKKDHKKPNDYYI